MLIKEKLVVMKRNERYTGNFPPFFDPSLFPEIKPLKDNWKAIRDEILQYEQKNGEIKGLDSNPYVAPQYKGVNWSNIFLLNFSIKHHNNLKKFPTLTSVLNQIPNCTFAIISILSPHTVIKPHYGDTNGIIRGHLGLVIPDKLPTCGIQVKNETRGWEEGEIVLFTEAFYHGSWNNSSKKRYVLLVDIVPKFMEKSIETVCSKLLGAQSYNYLEKRFPILEKISDRASNVIAAILTVGWRFYLPIQRRIKFL